MPGGGIDRLGLGLGAGLQVCNPGAALIQEVYDGEDKCKWESDWYGVFAYNRPNEVCSVSHPLRESWESSSL